MPDYIPSNEPAKILWLSNFSTWIIANGAAHGFTLLEVCALVATALQVKLAANNNVTQQAAAKAATAIKKTALATAIGLARDNAQRLQNNPNTTDGDRAAAGIIIPDTTRTPTATDNILTIPAPLLLLDFSVRRQITIHWGTNPANERENARPAGTIGCQVQSARGGIPAEEALWTTLEIDTQSPMIHTIHEDTHTTYAYRARYVGKNLKFGPFGDPAVCTVSV